MKDKLRIFFYMTSQDGVAFYRMYQPAKMIEKLGLAEVVMNPFDSVKRLKETWTDFSPDKNGEPKAAKKLELALGTPENPRVDAVIFQRMDTGVMFSTAMSIRELYNIPVLQETDDYVFDVPVANPASKDYRDEELQRQQNGEIPIATARMSLGVFDGYIVTTPFLKSFYENYAPTFLCPNSLDLSQRVFPEKKKHDDFRIMFSSSATHADNLHWIAGPIQRFLNEHPNARFYYYGKLPDFVKSKQGVKMKWVRPEKYAEYIHSLAPDVCLAPLHEDVLFNRAKSNLRLLEYWTSGLNAVIASPIGHYKETIKEGENGLFAREKDDWYRQLTVLYENPKLREKIARGGYVTAQKDYSLEKNARKWVDAVRESIRGYSPNRKPPAQYRFPGT